MKKFIVIPIALIVVLGGAVFVYKKLDNGNVIKELPILSKYLIWLQNRGSSIFGENQNDFQKIGTIPTAKPYQTPDGSPTPTAKTSPTVSAPVTSEVNLAIPFTIQAPNANWDEVHQEFCEEASVLMAVSYVKGWTIPSPEIADQKMMEIKAFEEKRFGYYKDTTAEETATIIRELYNYDKVKVVYDPTINDIKKAVADGKAVIIPAAGRQLGNPNFTGLGPLYHMLVVKGYTKEGNFITNDPGTRKGADYIYNPDVIMKAIHDWNGGDVGNGRKVVIVVG